MLSFKPATFKKLLCFMWPRQVLYVATAKFLRLPILENIYKWLFLDWFNGSVFLNQVLTCIWKPKTNTFDESNKFLNWWFLIVLDSFRLFQIVFGCFRSFLIIFITRSFLVILDHFSSLLTFISTLFNNQTVYFCGKCSPLCD